MKPPRGTADLAARLTSATATPLVAAPPPPPAPQAPAVQLVTAKRKTVETVAVFLRLEKPLHDRLDAEAMARTRATGRGVSIQQVILDRLQATS